MKWKNNIINSVTIFLGKNCWKACFLYGATIEGKCICELSSIAEYVSCVQKKQEAQ